MTRSILAVVFGYLFFTLFAVLYFSISKIEPANPPLTEDIFLTALFSSIAALTTGWISATVLKKRNIKPIIFLSSLIALIAIVSIVSQAGTSFWTQFMTIFLLAPLVYTGGILTLRRKK